MDELKKRGLIPITKAKCGECTLLETVNLNLSGKALTFYRCPKNKGLLQYIEPWIAEKCELFKLKS
ncbi:MAG: hypothetical protein QXI91_06810 [Candidatus Bathyarchaeia archaeon]